MVIKVTIISVYVTIMSLMHKNHITKISELPTKMLNLQMIINDTSSRPNLGLLTHACAVKPIDTGFW